MQEKARIIKEDYIHVLEKLKNEKQQFNIIFLDPPYRSTYDLMAIESIINNKLLTRGWNNSNRNR